MRARVLVRPKAGILDPQGQAVERALPALGFEGVQQRPRRAADRARRRGPRAAARDVRAAAGEPADRGLRDRGRSRSPPSVVKFGVVRFPGSCDDVDALRAAERVGEAVLLWHADRDLQGVDAVIVPGGFSYGDYLRAGAIARFAPVMEEVDGVRPRGRAGARDLQRLPGAVRGGPAARARCCPTTSLRFVFRQVELEVVDCRHAVHARVLRPASGCRSRSSTRPGGSTRRTPSSTARCGSGAAPLRPRAQPERLAATTSPACATRPATCSG